MKSLKKYQEKAVNEVFEYSAKSLKENKKATIIFKAPTGSGKTFMMGKIVEMIKELQNQNLCFVWATIGKGSLHEQTYSSLDKNLYGVRLLDRDFHGGRYYTKSTHYI